MRTIYRCLLVLGLLSGVINAQAQTNSEAKSGLAVGQIQFNVNDYKVEGFNPLSTKVTKAILIKYTGSFDDLSTIYDAANALEQAIKAKGYSLMSVVIPQQSVKNETIRLKTEGFKISSVDVTNNKHFSAENIKRSVPSLIVGENPNLKSVQRSLAVSNLHPSKRVSVNFLSQDKDAETVGAILRVTDQSPRQIFSWLNDAGNERTGEHRLGLGYQHNNLLDKDHSLTFTYTTSPQQPSDVRQIGINYRIPLYKYGGLIDLLGFDSDIDTGRVAEVFDVSGRGKTLRVGYTQLLAKRGNYGHKLYFSIEDKLFDNEVVFEGTSLVPDVRSRPVTIGYNNTLARGKAKLVNDVAVFKNISGGSLNTDQDYAASRVGATQDWQAMRVSSTLNVPLKSWRLLAQLKAQFSDQPLITGEQFGLGGQNSVRGFEERELVGDAGWFSSLQLWAPVYKGLGFGAFWDHGAISRRNPLEDEIASETIESIGAGVRWTSKDSHWSAKLDFAHVINGPLVTGPGITAEGDSRLHFTIIYKR